MESDDVYGRQWHVILPVKWANIRDKPGMQFITEVPFVPETRFTRLPAPEVTATDVQDNRWGGQSLIQIINDCPVVQNCLRTTYLTRPI